MKVLLCIFVATVACSLLPDKVKNNHNINNTKVAKVSTNKKAPVKQVKKKVTKSVIKKKPVRGKLPSRGFSGDILFVESTAYCKCARCCGKSNGITATGLQARRGVIAVDPRVIKLGTRIYVEGYGTAVAADTGGAIKGNRIDVCFNTHKEAINWGRKKVKIMIY